MVSASTYNSEPEDTPNDELTAKPFVLKEILRLRDGLELPRKGLPKFIAQKIHPKLQFSHWALLSLN